MTGKIIAKNVILAAGNIQVGLGMVAIDSDEGAPPAILWDGEVFLPVGQVDGDLVYRKVRAMRAGASFSAMP